MLNASLKIEFRRASKDYYNKILEWLEEPHVREFWDNSLEHRKDIFIFMNGRKEPSPYWNGIFDYWIGFMNGDPYCLLMTSEILPTQSDLSETWKMHLSRTGKTYSIDFMIGNKNYLGRGLAAFTLEFFIKFIHDNDSLIDTFLIDPAEYNPKAKHVYEKSGFSTVATFFRNIGDKEQIKHYLMVKKL